MFWGGGRSTKRCVFPCQVAAAGDERYLLCAAGAAVVVSGSNRFSPGVLQRVGANRIVMAAWMCRWCCQTHCNSYMIVARALFWGGSRSTKRCVFPCKVAAAGDEGSPLQCGKCGSGRFGDFRGRIGSPLVFCNVWMQIAL